MCPVSRGLRAACLLALAAACLNAGFRSDRLSPHAVSSFLHEPAGWMEVEATLAEDPEQRLYSGGDRGPWQAEAVVHAVRAPAGWTNATGRVLLRDRLDFLVGLRAGDRCRVGGRLEARWTYPRQGRLDLRGQRQVLVERAEETSWRRFLADRRAWAAFQLEQGLGRESEAASVLKALLLGMREGIPPYWMNRFAATGTIHVFAISGLHVGLVSLILIGMIRTAGLGVRLWMLPLAPLLIFYTLLTGAAPSAIRACVMALCFWSALTFQRKPDGPSAVAMAALLMLMADPDQILSLGFQFSFLVVIGLLMLAGPLQARLLGHPEDRLESPHPSWLHRCRESVRRWACAALAVSITAWLVSMPLTAMVFNRFTPIALLGNLVVAPSVFMILSLGLASLLLSGWPVLSVGLNTVNGWIIEGVLGLIHLFSEIPGAHAYVQSPPLWWAICVYVLLILFRFGRGRWRKRGVAALVVILSCSAALRVAAPPGLIVLPAGEGMSLLIDTRSSSDLLIDTGPWLNGWERVQALRRRGTDRLKHLILTHPDADHYGALDFFREAMPIQQISIGPLQGSSAYRERLASFQGGETQIRRREVGWLEAEAADWQVEILFPKGSPDVRRADNGSLVLRVTRGLRSALILGDAGQHVQRQMLASGIDPAADFLVLSPGLDEVPLDPVFLSWAAPKTVVLSGMYYSDREWSELVEASGLPWMPDIITVDGEPRRIAF